MFCHVGRVKVSILLVNVHRNCDFTETLKTILITAELMTNSVFGKKLISDILYIVFLRTV